MRVAAFKQIVAVFCANPALANANARRIEQAAPMM
jgi:hypothetical protein